MAEVMQRKAFLHLIEVVNFKSYKEKVIIGPFKMFNAVTGPNGSGKSNFMDAISFVMGEQTKALRVKKLSDLIHGAVVSNTDQTNGTAEEQSDSQTASVTAVFKLANDMERRFTRTIQRNTSEYSVDDQHINAQEYLAQLEELGVNAKAKNFLVFQGTVESIAEKNPKERTRLFEEISGSGVFKGEYEELKKQMLSIEEKLQYVYLKKRSLRVDQNEAKWQMEETRKYQQLKSDLAVKEIEWQLFRLYHNEKCIQSLQEAIENKRNDVMQLERRKELLENTLEARKKKHGKASREIAKIEQDIREVEIEINKINPSSVKSQERVTHLQKKLDSTKKSLEKALNADDAHRKDIEKLEHELAEVEKQRKDYEDTVAGESQSQGRDVQLEEEQMEEYRQLKAETQKQMVRILQELVYVNREQKADEDRLDNELRAREELKAKIKQKNKEKEVAQERYNKFTQHIQDGEKKFEYETEMVEKLRAEVDRTKSEVAQLQNELDNVCEQLANARIDKYNVNRDRKKEESVQALKDEFGTCVYGRLINVCKVVNTRYNVAITKVLGKYMDAIVVDTEVTARSCIQYLKKKELDPETFLPIDYLEVKPLKERLRDIIDRSGVKLLFDVLKFDDKYRRAVLFVTNNALICETPEDAMYVAYEMDQDVERYNVVSLDGTYYQKSGIISGGSVDLTRKARRWDEAHVSELKCAKDNLTKKLRDAMKVSKKEHELNMVESQRKGIMAQLQCVRSDQKHTQQQIDNLKKELADLESNLKETEPRIDDIRRATGSRDQNIKVLKVQMNNAEDNVFAEFCERVGIANIRQYEERELRSQQERARKRLEFENEKNRIINELDFEKATDTRNNVVRLERTVSEEQGELERAIKVREKHVQNINQKIAQLEQLKTSAGIKQAEEVVIHGHFIKAREDVKTLMKELGNAQKRIVFLEGQLEKRTSERCEFLTECKIEAINIPLVNSSFEHISQITEDQDSMEEFFDFISQLQVDYSSLSDHLKEIDELDVQNKKDELAKSITDLLGVLQHVKSPNLKAEQKWKLANASLQETERELASIRKHLKTTKRNFERIQKERYDTFMNCFDHVQKNIDNIYKSLSQNQSAQAELGLENPEEPYLEGMHFTCVAPGKCFQTISNFSGGEKTMAALALLFAIQSFRAAPFFVLDEIDAALDNSNIRKLVSYIQQQKDELQCIMITLNENVYSYSNALIGICPEKGESLISKVYTISLDEYPD